MHSLSSIEPCLVPDTAAVVAVPDAPKPAVELTTEQQGVLQGLRDRRKAGRPHTVLHGLAGTGKTTLVSRFACENPTTKVVAFTGKAASVLRSKIGMAVTTIHGQFYQLVSAIEKKGEPPKLTFGKRYGPNELAGVSVIIDECSMVNGPMAGDILEAGCHVIACGDPGQLPPVFGERFFNAADYTLLQIHRQALESPIIRQAHAVRAGQPYAADGEAFRVTDRRTDRDMAAANAILVWSNQTRKRVNQRMRAIAGLSGFPRQGEPVLCFRNSHLFGIYNGCVYTLAADFPPRSSTISLIVEGVPLVIPYVLFDGELEPDPQLDGRRRPRKFTSQFDFGYALTVHKAQGSEWPSVLLIDEYQRRDQRKEWLYTGITRASDRITVVQGGFV